MLSKCANPDCDTPFHYFREGRLYHFDIRAAGDGALSPQHGGKKPVRRVEHFWLCGRCAANMTLKLEGDRRVVVVPSRVPRLTALRRAAAS